MPLHVTPSARRRGSLLVAILAVTALFAVGCSGTEDTSDTTTPEPTSDIESSIDSEDATDQFVVEPWSEQLEIPTGLTFLPDGTALAIEKGGFEGASTARVVHLDADGAELGTAMELPVCADAERGLIGIVADPEIDQNGSVYLYYTRQMAGCAVGEIGEVPPADRQVMNRLSSFTYADGRLDPTSEVPLIDDIPAFQSAHNGGGMQFDPDGRLLVGVGDSQLRETAQDPSTLSGKILRIDPRTGEAPTDNPNLASSPRPPGSLVYATGLRNPYRFGVDPATGTVVVADVGDVEYEELNLVTPGGNYGWPDSEGPGGATGEEPILWYTHGGDDNCGAVIGGPFARSTSFGDEYEGTYLFGDFGCGRIWSVTIEQGAVVRSRLIARSGLTLTDLTIGPDGALYASSTGGVISRIARA